MTLPADGVVALLIPCCGCTTATETLLRPTTIRGLSTQVAILLPPLFRFLFPLEAIEFVLACVVVIQRLIGSTAITTI
jgi:hypothetical protein